MKSLRGPLLLGLLSSLISILAQASGVSGVCPKAADIQMKFQDVRLGEFNVRYYWNEQNGNTKPYALDEPGGFIDGANQARQAVLRILGSDASLPLAFEFVVIGPSLGAQYDGVAALYCESEQTVSGVFRLLVNSTFVEDPLVFRRLLAHELFHAISDRAGKMYPTWLEEGLAMTIEAQAIGDWGYAMAAHHLRHSPWMSLESPLFQSVDDEKERRNYLLSFYGHSQLFMAFLKAKLGPDIFSEIFHSQSSDPERIFSQLLKKSNSRWRSFQDVFVEFELAKYLNSTNSLADISEDAERYLIFDESRYFGRLKMNLAQKDRELRGIGAFVPKDYRHYLGRENHAIYLVVKSALGEITIRPVKRDEGPESKMATRGAPNASYHLIVKYK